MDIVDIVDNQILGAGQILERHNLWTMWTMGFKFVQTVHSILIYAGAGGEIVDKVDTLDMHFKSLAYIVCVTTLYRYTT